MAFSSSDNRKASRTSSELRHPVEPDDGQRTLNLMQMRSAKTNLRQVSLAGLELAVYC